MKNKAFLHTLSLSLTHTHTQRHTHTTIFLTSSGCHNMTTVKAKNNYPLKYINFILKLKMKARYSAANYCSNETIRACTDLLHISIMTTWVYTRKIMKITTQQTLHFYLKTLFLNVQILYCNASYFMTHVFLNCNIKGVLIL